MSDEDNRKPPRTKTRAQTAKLSAMPPDVRRGLYLAASDTVREKQNVLFDLGVVERLGLGSFETVA